ncbi:CocE/NonD family hydrolase [Alcaligenes sp. DN25]|uniref:CocE/NonD family hydrolase n=1 Tax=Alcaligenes TaxID=507 RepID=UPI0020307B13|nr:MULTISPECIES: CocE/NonD family hydrolase [Alcaligenes]URW82185.1 CocE/NonD family hydrolase [Alcaligenes sp. DN25]WEA67006.1 CocE/NonD family hydrolase [Alcaligenes faecalis]
MMRLNLAALQRWVLGLFLIGGLLACSGQTVMPPEKNHYEFSMENDSLEMRDGVRLAVTYYRPSAKTPGETFPVILEMLPYRKDDFFALGDYEYGSYFAKRGYVLARVDVRGTGGSSGPVPVSEYSAAEIADAEELIDQLSRKSWSNGKVGMYGLSWSAFNSLMTAHRKPPALKAIIAAHGSTDLFYNDVHYIDGALHIDSYAHQIDTDNAMPQSPDYRIDQEYFKNRFDREPWIFTWLRQQQDGDFWRAQSLAFKKQPLEVPAYLIGGLLDGYRDFALNVSRTSKAPVIVEMGPWNHAWPEYGVPGPNYEWREKAVRWWDYWLKDIDTGILDEPRRMAFMRTGHAPATDRTSVPGYWRCDPQWPVEGARTQRLHPQAGHQLAAISPASGLAQTLRYKAGAGLAGGGWWGEQTGDMAADDAHSLVYDSAPLSDAMEIMGMPKVRLKVAADAPFYQWIVRLEDVAPNGQVSLVSGAIINPSQRISRLEPQPLVPGKATNLETSIHFTTWRFKPGHRIRLAVSNAQFPMVWPSPTPGVTSLFPGADTWVDLPVVPVREQGTQACVMSPPQASEAAPFGRTIDGDGPMFSSVRNEATGDSTFTTSNELSWVLHDNLYRSEEMYRWEVNDATPAKARYQGDRRNVFTIKGREIDMSAQARIESDESYFYLTFTRVLKEDGVQVREKTWQERIARIYQ